MKAKLFHGVNFCFGDNSVVGTYGLSEETVENLIVEKVNTLLKNKPVACFAEYPLSGVGIVAEVDVKNIHCIDVDSYVEDGVRKVSEYFIEDGKCVYETPKEEITDLYGWMENTAPVLRGRKNDRTNYYCEVFGVPEDLTAVWFTEGYPEHERYARKIADLFNLPILKVEKKTRVWEI